MYVCVIILDVCVSEYNCMCYISIGSVVIICMYLYVCMDLYVCVSLCVGA